MYFLIYSSFDFVALPLPPNRRLNRHSSRPKARAEFGIALVYDVMQAGRASLPARALCKLPGCRVCAYYMLSSSKTIYTHTRVPALIVGVTCIAQFCLVVAYAVKKCDE